MRTYTTVLIAILTTGCSFSSTKTLSIVPREPPPRVLVLGRVIHPPREEFDESKQVWSSYARLFEKGMREWVRNHGHGQWGFSTDPKTAGPNDVIVVGTITRVDQGYAALRFWVGLGAGQAKMAGDFEVRTARGEILHKFHGRESYFGGWGIGGWDFLDMGDLALRFGETVAEQAMDWTRDNLVMDIPK